MRELILFGIYNLRQHKLRTLLTSTSIIIATFVVSFFLVISDTIRYTVNTGIEMLGMTDIVVDRYDWEREKNLKKSVIERRVPVGEKEYHILQKLRGIKFISRVIRFNGDVEFNKRIKNDVDIIGSDPDYLGLRHYKIHAGRGFTLIDNKLKKPVCVMGYEVARELGIKKVPDYFLINGRTYIAAGILSKMGEVLQNRPDNVVICPFSALYTPGTSVQIHIFIDPEVDRKKIKNEIKNTLESIRKRYGIYGKFGVNDMFSVFKSFKGISTNITYVLFAVSFISLLVASIGIANVMLTSARERIHEIGILRSLGLNKFSIFILFVVESVVLSLLGAIVGIPSGVILAYLLILAGGKGIIFHVTLAPFLVSLFLSMFTGVIAGIYPAFEASKREIVEALRYL